MLALNLMAMVAEPKDKVSADCFNDPFVPDEIAPLEKELHKFLDNTSMQELNVSLYIKSKNWEESNKVKQAIARCSMLMKPGVK